MTDCSCTCHGHGSAHQPPCTVPGGCGHLHSALCILPHRDDRVHEQEIGLLCRWHRNRLDWVINEIRKLNEDLDQITEAGSAPKANTAKGRRLSNPSPPAPANLDVLVLRDPRSHGDVDSPDDAQRQPWSVPYLTEVYCYRVRDERNLTRVVLRQVLHRDRVLEVPTTVKADVPRSVVGRLDMLLRHHDWIAAQDWVDDYLTEMTELKRAMATALRDNTHRFMGRCYLIGATGEACGGDLLQENGSLFVTCRRDRGHTWRSARELAALEIGLKGGRTA